MMDFSEMNARHLGEQYKEIKTLKAENEKLKKQVASLAAQLDSLLERQSKAARRQYDDERDYLPYHEYEER